MSLLLPLLARHLGPIAPPETRPDDWDLTHVDLSLWIDPQEEVLEGKAILDIRPLVDAPGPLRLDLDGPEILSLKVDGAEAESRRVGDQLEVKVGRGRQVEVVWTAAFNDGEMDRGINLNRGQVFTFSEPEGARRWLVLQDEPSEKFTLDMHVSAPDDLTVSANGTPGPVTASEGGFRTWSFSLAQPIPTYLIVVNAADFAVLSDKHGELPLRHYVPPAMALAVEAPLAVVPEVIGALEEHFGPYPFDSYADTLIYDFPGGMEHSTNTTLGAEYVDSDWGPYLHAHEIAHHWWGDWVTLSSWDEIWLNEGFASYAEVLWHERAYGEAGRREYVSYQADTYFEWQDYEGVFPVADPEYMWGGTVYNKGSVVLDMLRTLVGDEAFFGGLRAYGEAHAHGNATIDDFASAMEGASGQDLSWFFEEWLYRAGDPVWAWDAHQREVAPGVWQLDIMIEQEDASPWTMPVHIGWEGGGEDIRISKARETFTFCLDASPVGVRPDPEGLIPTASWRSFDADPAPITCADPADTAAPLDSEDDGPLIVGLQPAGPCGCGGAAPASLLAAAALALGARRRVNSSRG